MKVQFLIGGLFVFAALPAFAVEASGASVRPPIIQNIEGDSASVEDGDTIVIGSDPQISPLSSEISSAPVIVPAKPVMAPITPTNSTSGLAPVSLEPVFTVSPR